MKKRKRQESLREGVDISRKRRWHSLIDKIWAMPNMEEAFKEVKRNRGAPGVDGMTIKAFESELESNLRTLQHLLKTKTYKPRPVKRVYIPKADGSQRPLGIPTVGDRVVQAAAKRILEPIFEETFMDCSFGFRPGRNAHMALEKIHRDLMDGYLYVIDADLKSYFDLIPQDKLIQTVREEVVDGSVIKLLERFLQSGVMEDGTFHLNEQGTPQGGVISPLLANIYLHPLDKEMTRRGHRLTRYADDFVICCKTEKGAQRVLRSVTRLLEQELGLIVHPEKTKIVNNKEQSFFFLGHEFKPGFWLKPTPKAIMKFKEQVKEITRRNQTTNVEQLIKKKLNPYLRGWGNYFGRGHVKKDFEKFDAWIRRRLRMVQMRSWRKLRNLHRELRKKGWKTRELPEMRMTAWRSSRTTATHVVMPNEWFKTRGLVFLVDIYNEHHPQRG
ncbi:group II intron reverse transcriptase/maturase [Paenibacillus qinlingensis]|uniref:Group II intron reverse transcriptase/maturase n=1 Tax=Paenibacillus qinlingensis TaxID=1837343 RepID=A0ABU1P7K2_9BACL|nr:group II intron reverse transcriptase/maturase [Paenibacillus qinlingensis]MDR6555668.1 group II intron reverse transcriptase/maturase [Paenibacillus qinlingensis]